jgi:hypothetical protein
MTELINCQRVLEGKKQTLCATKAHFKLGHYHRAEAFIITKSAP